ncbi:MAG TPA: acetate kinase, partial [Acidocella sp.]|nr:acetate kinase [Acidocella sp.]
MPDAILTLNAGSSSIKFALFEASEHLARMASGEVENIGAAPHLRIHAGTGLALERSWPQGAALSHEELLGAVLHWVEDHLGPARLIAAGHRIVHGGEAFIDPVRLDRATLEDLAR